MRVVPLSLQVYDQVWRPHLLAMGDDDGDEYDSAAEDMEEERTSHMEVRAMRILSSTSSLVPATMLSYTSSRAVL